MQHQVLIFVMKQGHLQVDINGAFRYSKANCKVNCLDVFYAEFRNDGNYKLRNEGSGSDGCESKIVVVLVVLQCSLVGNGSNNGISDGWLNRGSGCGVYRQWWYW